jgi:hypothetical protein
MNADVHPEALSFDVWNSVRSLDRVIAGAVPRIRDLGLQDRCEAVAGDFFKGCRRVAMPTS